MDDLAADLRMSKKTLYACFPSKSSLVEAVLKSKFSEVEADLGRLASEESSGMEEAIHRFLQRVQRHTAEIHPSFVRDLGREAPDLFRIVEHRRRRLIRRHVASLFSRGRKAGLIRKDFQDTVRQVPLLGSLPIIGTLFRSTGFQNEQTELVIILTPRLVQPVRAGMLKVPTDRVRPPNEADLFLNGRTDSAVPPSSQPFVTKPGPTLIPPPSGGMAAAEPGALEKDYGHAL